MSAVFNTTIHITCMLSLSTTYYWLVTHVSTCIHVVKIFFKICMTNSNFLSVVSYTDHSQPHPCVLPTLCVLHTHTYSYITQSQHPPVNYSSVQHADDLHASLQAAAQFKRILVLLNVWKIVQLVDVRF